MSHNSTMIVPFTLEESTQITPTPMDPYNNMRNMPSSNSYGNIQQAQPGSPMPNSFWEGNTGNAHPMNDNIFFNQMDAARQSEGNMQQMHFAAQRQPTLSRFNQNEQFSAFDLEPHPLEQLQTRPMPSRLLLQQQMNNSGLMDQMLFQQQLNHMNSLNAVDPMGRMGSGSMQDLMAANGQMPRQQFHNYSNLSLMSMNSSASSRKKKRVKTFPEKFLYSMMEYANEDAVAWLPDGKSFVVVSPDLFVEEILNKVFKKAKYTSFIRKLHRWGFIRLTSGTGTDCFHHPLFQKGRNDLAAKITCTPRDKDEPAIRSIATPSLAGVEKYIRAKSQQSMSAKGEEEQFTNDVSNAEDTTYHQVSSEAMKMPQMDFVERVSM